MSCSGQIECLRFRRENTLDGKGNDFVTKRTTSISGKKELDALSSVTSFFCRCLS